LRQQAQPTGAANRRSQQAQTTGADNRRSQQAWRLLLVCVLCNFFTFKVMNAQNEIHFSCGTPHPSQESLGEEINHSLKQTTLVTYPCGGDSTFYIRTAVHFFLRHDGTGNFNEFDDGRTNDLAPIGAPANYHQLWNGYAFAAQVINAANVLFKENHTYTYTATSPCTIPATYTPPPPQIKIQYVLTGVYFHRMGQVNNSAVTNASTALSLLNSTYAIDRYNTLNIVFGPFSSPDGIASGIPAPFGYMTTATTNSWNTYTATNHWTNIIWSSGSVVRNALNHEVGHLLGLWHVFEGDDYCADTPPCSDGKTNNLMDYGLDKKVITHEQRDRMYTCLLGSPLYNGTYYASTSHIPAYKYECSLCSPAYSFSRVHEKCATVYVGGGWYGTWSSGQNQFIEIFETDAYGSNTVVANYYYSWTTATLSSYLRNLSAIYSFTPNKWYKVKMAVQNDCTSWHESSNWILYSGAVNQQLCGGGSGGTERISLVSDAPVQVYPNPNNGTFTLSVPQPFNAPLQVNITDISGKVQYQTSVTENISNIQVNLPAGLYFIHIPEKNFTQKIIINH
jgi:hypothetical protein